MATQAPSGKTDNLDPHGYLHPEMRVIGEGGKALGKVKALERDSESGRLTALDIRHGLLGRKVTRVEADRVKWINPDSVVLTLSQAAFEHLPLVEGH